jgi:hypothetical protein
MNQTIDPDITAVMYRPVLIRAGIALIFGIATFFIQDPSEAVVNYGTAIFFLFSGSAMWEYLRRDPVPAQMRTPLSLIAAIWMLAAVTLVGVQLWDLSATVTWVTIAVALGLSGLLELWAFTWRKTFPPARDHLIAGIAAIVVTVLFFVMALDYHRIFGITGTYALVVGVLFAITGIGYWLDTRKAIQEHGYKPPRP